MGCETGVGSNFHHVSINVCVSMKEWMAEHVTFQRPLQLHSSMLLV